MRREAEGGRWSGNGIGGELPGRGNGIGGVVGSCQWRGDVGSCLKNSNVLPFRGETWALENSGGETWALLFLKTTPISDETEGVL